MKQGAHRLTAGNPHAIPVHAIITTARARKPGEQATHTPKPAGLIAREARYCSLRWPSAPCDPAQGGARPGRGVPLGAPGLAGPLSPRPPVEGV